MCPKKKWLVLWTEMNTQSISNAFFQEAKENFCAAKILFGHLKEKKQTQMANDDSIIHLRGSSLFVLLQMAVEKLCKAAYAKQQNDKKMPPHTHDLKWLMDIAMRNPSLKALFKKSNPTAYDFLMKELNPLQPSNARENSENLEYPWITARNKVKFPAANLKLINKYLHDPHNRSFSNIMWELDSFVLSFNKIMRNI